MGTATVNDLQHCTACGAPSGGTAFCRGCGAPLGAAAGGPEGGTSTRALPNGAQVAGAAQEWAKRLWRERSFRLPLVAAAIALVDCFLPWFHLGPVSVTPAWLVGTLPPLLVFGGVLACLVTAANRSGNAALTLATALGFAVAVTAVVTFAAMFTSSIAASRGLGGGGFSESLGSGESGGLSIGAFIGVAANITLFLGLLRLWLTGSRVAGSPVVGR